MDQGIEYIRNDKHAGIVKAFTVLGRDHRTIAKYLELDDDTLRKYYAVELATAKDEAELNLFAKMTQFLNSDDEAIGLNAGKFLASRRFGWKEDKSVDTEATQTIFDAVVQAAAAQLLAKKEKENDH